MTLEEAINIMTRFLPPFSDGLDQDEKGAINLGIEALKCVGYTRHEAPEFFIPLLLGETKE